MYIWGKGRAAGWVGSGQTFCLKSRIGLGRGQRFVGSGRVQKNLVMFVYIQTGCK